jgi:hypothetical protein
MFNKKHMTSSGMESFTSLSLSQSDEAIHVQFISVLKCWVASMAGGKYLESYHRGPVEDIL